VRIALDWLAAFMYLLKGKTGNFTAVFQAHISFIGAIGNNQRKRRQLRNQYPHYSRVSLYTGIVIVDFFLRGKRKIGQ
jgi:hypothetical protein